MNRLKVKKNQQKMWIKKKNLLIIIKILWIQFLKNYQHSQLTNIEITDGNIKSFERIARKYAIDFSLKKDASEQPPKYIVFFKAKDVDVMTAAFKEFAGNELKKTKKPSRRKRLAKAVDKSKQQHRQKEKQKTKDRGQVI